MDTDKRYLPASKLRRRYGDCSDMTLWRWIKDDRLQFPKPIYINGRRYWDEYELDKFDQRQATKRGTPLGSSPPTGQRRQLS
jgi:predicted DNA-binding transcriptional regulator AlpA